jgi:hypothetical protein
MEKSSRQRLLELVIARIGRPSVVERLQIPPCILDDWLTGEAHMPDRKLLALVGLIDETCLQS